MKKDRFFWYFLIPWLVILTSFISLSPWLAELFATPKNQVFTGINRWSTDYYIYLSYVEQGVRGFLSTKLIFTTQPHSALYFFLAYTIPGYIFGHIFGLNSIIIYHLFRTLYGLIFLSMSVFFFYKLSKSKAVTLMAFIFTFYVSGFVKITSLMPFQAVRYLDWLQEQNIIGRATGPLHYNAGFIVFIGAFIFYFYSKAAPLKKSLILGLFLNGLLLTNPFNFLLMALCFAVYLPIKLIFYKKDSRLFREFMIVFGAAFLSLPLFLILNYYLSAPPWGLVSVAPKFYVKTILPVNFFEVAFSVGPIFFLGILGAIRLFYEQFTNVIPAKAGIQTKYTFLKSDYRLDPLLRGDDKKHISSSVLIFLTIWPVIQFLLLIYGDSFKIHPARAFSGLYYLPLSYFSAQLIYLLVKDYKKQILIICLFFLLTLPNFYLSYKEQLFAFTDFKYFSPFIYPSKKQVDAFKFLEKNTPAYSEVLALFEAGTLINGFSGNTTEVSIDQNLKMPFYANQLNNQEAIKFLKRYHYQYIYFGYQEKFSGGNMDKYPFLKKIYQNEEVQIYRKL